MFFWMKYQSGVPPLDLIERATSVTRLASLWREREGTHFVLPLNSDDDDRLRGNETLTIARDSSAPLDRL